MAEPKAPSKVLTAMVLLFMAGSGLISLGILLLPGGESPGPPKKGPRRAGTFDDQRAGERVQAEVERKARTRVHRDSSIDYSASPGDAAHEAPLHTEEAPAVGPGPGSGEDDSALAEAVPGWSEGMAGKLGSEEGLLSKLAGKMFKHPKVLRALFNNETLVNAYMKRDLVKKNCADAGALKSYLSDGASPGGVSQEVSLVKSALKNPGVGSAFAGTRLASALGSCSSVKGLMADPGALGAIRAANPELAALVSNPAVMMSVAANPEAMSMYKQIPK